MKRIRQGSIDGIEILQNERQAIIDYQSAIANYHNLEIEHNKKMGKYQDNDEQYYKDKLSTYDDLIDAATDELDVNGVNYELQMKLWSLEEERYNTQLAINNAKTSEIGLTQRLTDEMMQGPLGFAYHYRNIAESSLARAGISSPSFSAKPNIVYMNSNSGGEGNGTTTNYYVNGVNFANPQDMLMNLQYQKQYQTGRTLF